MKVRDCPERVHPFIHSFGQRFTHSWLQQMFTNTFYVPARRPGAESKLGSRPKFQKAETSVPSSASCVQRALHTVGVQATVLIN